VSNVPMMIAAMRNYQEREGLERD